MYMFNSIKYEYIFFLQFYKVYKTIICNIKINTMYINISNIRFKQFNITFYALVNNKNVS